MHQLKNLTATEKALIEYIEKDPLNFIQMKPKEIASQAYISVASIYRLISKLELDGFNDLKVAVNLSLQQKRENIENIDYPILPTDSHYEVMLRLKKVYENTILDTLDLIDPETLVCISQLMNQSAAIDVYTSSANLYFALNFQFQMQEINVPIQVYEDEYRQGLCAANSDPSHLALVISFGGRSENIKRICKILKNNQTPIVLITSTDNPLIEMANELIYMSGIENHYDKISSFSTRMTLLYILDTLYAIYFKQNYEKNTQYKKDTYHKMTLQK